MYLMDFSINVLTLLGIVLSIGLVVDDAIVVLENIYSRIEKGEEPGKAAEKGSEEIFFAASPRPPLSTALSPAYSRTHAALWPP